MKTIGVIGLGSIGMRHAKNLKDLGHTVIGFDPLPVGLEVPVIWPLPEKRLSELDAVVIASPTDRHYDDIYMCLQDNMNVFVEKPIANSLEEPLDPSLLRQVKMVGYNLRFHSCVKEAKKWLDSGNIGKPLWANFTLSQYSEKPPYLRDGVILNWSHEIDLAIYLLGDAKVAASATRITRHIPDPITKLATENDDMTDIILRHSTGCQTNIHLDYLTAPEKRHFTIVGESGSIEVNVASFTCSLQTDDGDNHGMAFSHKWNNTYIDEMQAFLDRCDGKETIGCSGEEGLKVLEICLEVRKQAGLT